MYTLQDYDTTKPYKELELIEDPFEKQIKEQQLETEAKALGFKHFRKTLAAYRKTLKSASFVTLANGGVTDFEGQPAEFRLASWNADETGIWRKGRDGQREYACSHPICPARLLSNIDTGEMKVELWYKRGYEGRPVTQVVDYDTIANARNIVGLAKIGIDVDSNTAKNLVAYLSEVTNLNYDRLPRTNTVSHLGWNREGFAPFTGEVEYDGNPNFDVTFRSIGCKGDMEKWFDEVRACRAYSRAIHIITAASFASCLIEPLGILPFFVHLWSSDSGCGKTVGQMVGASVWGNPTPGENFFPSFRATTVGFELLAGFLRNIPMFIDELQLTKDKDGKSRFNVYELASGSGKLRGTRTLGLANVPKWNICFITSGESPLVSDTDGAGALNRVIEVENPAGTMCIEDGHRTATTLKENYGFGGKVFILKLREDGAIERAKELYNQFFMKCNADKTSEKQATAAAAILAADTLASEWIFGDTPLTADDLRDVLKSSSEVSMSERGYNQFCDWCMMNLNNFVREDEPTPGVCYGKLQEVPADGCKVAFIYPSAFTRFCEEKRQDPKALISNLKTKGLLKLDKDGKRPTVTKLINGVVSRVYAIKISEENDEEGTDAFDYDF